MYKIKRWACLVNITLYITYRIINPNIYIYIEPNRTTVVLKTVGVSLSYLLVIICIRQMHKFLFNIIHNRLVSIQNWNKILKKQPNKLLDFKKVLLNHSKKISTYD